MSRLLFVILLGILSGCATPIVPPITTWVSVQNNKLQGLEADKTYSVVPYGGQERSSEFTQYESLIKQELTKHGFVAVQPESATWYVVISYGITHGASSGVPSAPSIRASRERSDSYPIDNTQKYEKSLANRELSRSAYLVNACEKRLTTVEGGNGPGASGGAGTTNNLAYIWYKHFLTLQIHKKEIYMKEDSFNHYPRERSPEPRSGYSVSAYNYDATPKLSVVMPALIQALFVDFPNQMASSRLIMRCIE
jgi:hypothetical protein